jgi:hypothetical protein
MSRCTTIIHEGKEILHFNYVGLRGEELLNTIKTATRIMLEASGSELLVLADFTDTYVDNEIMGYLQGEESKRASQNAKKIAAVGITGLKKLFMNMYNIATRANARAFNTVEAAKRYLVS